MWLKIISIVVLLLFASIFVYYNLPEYRDNEGNSRYQERQYSFHKESYLAQISNESIEDAVSQGEQVLQEHVLPAGEGILEKISSLFTIHAMPFLENLFERIVEMLRGHVEPIIEEKKEEFTEDVKEGIQGEVEGVTQSIWERFKGLIDERLNSGEEN
jgi:hypothetical protein